MAAAGYRRRSTVRVPVHVGVKGAKEGVAAGAVRLLAHHRVRRAAAHEGRPEERLAVGCPCPAPARRARRCRRSERSALARSIATSRVEVAARRAGVDRLVGARRRAGASTIRTTTVSTPARHSARDSTGLQPAAPARSSSCIALSRSSSIWSRTTWPPRMLTTWAKRASMGCSWPVEAPADLAEHHRVALAALHELLGLEPEVLPGAGEGGDVLLHAVVTPEAARMRDRLRRVPVDLRRQKLEHRRHVATPEGLVGGAQVVHLPVGHEASLPPPARSSSASFTSSSARSFLLAPHVRTDQRSNPRSRPSPGRRAASGPGA